MPKPLQYLLAWAVATSIGVGVALLGVQVVLESTSAKRPSLIKAPAGVATGTQVSGTSSPPPPTSSATPTPARKPTATTRPSPSRAPSARAAQPTRSPSRCEEGDTGDGGGGSGGTAGFIQSYELLGGRAAVRFAPGRVCLVSATPRSGHVVTVVPERPDRLLVRFRSGRHQSELDASWAGRPVVLSRESFF